MQHIPYRQETQQTIARRMLVQNIPLGTIAPLTGMAIAEIQDLQDAPS